MQARIFLALAPAIILLAGCAPTPVVGSFLNAVGEEARECRRLAVEEWRLGIPLLFGLAL